MCGICVTLCRSQDLSPSEEGSKLFQAFEHLKANNVARGMSCLHQKARAVDTPDTVEEYHRSR